MARIVDDKERARRDFEANQVYAAKELPRAIYPTGYDAYRVSPRTTTRFGKKYRAIYGASISPVYGRSGYTVDVQWYPHGYTVPSVKPGTKMIGKRSSFPVNQEELKRKLML